MTDKDTVNSTNLFGIMLFIAGSIHAILIFSIGFSIPPKKLSDRTLNTMEIILVHHRSETTPKDAKYLAQASHEGGGSEQEKVRPSSQMSTPNITPDQGHSPQKMQAASPEHVEIVRPKLILQQRSKMTLNNKQQPQENPIKKPLTAEELIEQDMEIAKLSSQLSEIEQAYAQSPKKKFISANTKEYAPAQYLEAWRRKVEYTGNLNYPQEAIKRNIYGELRLQVDVNMDGTIHDIILLQSSGHEILDNAAIKIVRKSAPFDKITDDILQRDNDEQANILSIVRTWQFKDKRLKTRE